MGRVVATHQRRSGGQGSCPCSSRISSNTSCSRSAEITRRQGGHPQAWPSPRHKGVWGCHHSSSRSNNSSRGSRRSSGVCSLPPCVNE
jgi:hypothetical protein